MYGKYEGAKTSKTKKELGYMLKYMTKEEFIKAVDERKFVVRNVKGNKYEVSMITQQIDPTGVPKYGICAVINPNTKDGFFTQSGGGYNKALASIEDIALYVNEHAEDKDTNEVDCVAYFGRRQNYNTI